MNKLNNIFIPEKKIHSVIFYGVIIFISLCMLLGLLYIETDSNIVGLLPRNKTTIEDARKIAEYKKEFPSSDNSVFLAVEFGEMTHLPKLPLTFQMQNGYFSCDIFEYIYDDNDEYHHNEYITVRMEMFDEINNEKQQVKKESLNDEELKELRAKREQLYNLIMEASELYERFSEYNDSLDIPSLDEGEME